MSGANCLFEAPYSTSSVEIKQVAPYTKNFCTAYSPEPGCVSNQYGNPLLDGRDYFINYVQRHINPAARQVCPKPCNYACENTDPGFNQDGQAVYFEDASPIQLSGAAVKFNKPGDAYAPPPITPPACDMRPSPRTLTVGTGCGDNLREGFDYAAQSATEQKNLTDCFNQCNATFPVKYGYDNFQYPNRLWRDSCNVDCSQRYDSVYNNTLEGFDGDMMARATGLDNIMRIGLMAAAVTMVIMLIRDKGEWNWKLALGTAVPIFLAFYVLNTFAPAIGNTTQTSAGFGLGLQLF